jgi:hypothetical protein
MINASKTLRWILFLAVLSYSAPKRSRAEAIPGMHASNTAGLGDIWLQTGVTGLFRVTPVSHYQLLGLVDSAYRSDAQSLAGEKEQMGRDVQLAPSLKATIGLAEFLSLEVENVPWDGEKIGASRAGLLLTTPGNDDLRVFGVAVMADATLSTEEDIYSRGETTPGFDPLFHYGIVADADFIKWTPTLPIKLYLNWNTLSEYRLAHAFKQQWLAGGLEWKGYRREYYSHIGFTWFKALSTRFNPDPKTDWEGPHSDLALGTRWFFGDRFWGNAEISFDPIRPLAFYSDATHSPPRFFVGFDIPVVFQETRAEAVRALIYNEELRRQARRKDMLSPNQAIKNAAQDSTQKSQPSLVGIKLDQLELKNHRGDSASADLKALFENSEDVTAEKRKRVRQELQHIEDLLP